MNITIPYHTSITPVPVPVLLLLNRLDAQGMTGLTTSCMVDLLQHNDIPLTEKIIFNIMLHWAEAHLGLSLATTTTSAAAAAAEEAFPLGSRSSSSCSSSSDPTQPCEGLCVSSTLLTPAPSPSPSTGSGSGHKSFCMLDEQTQSDVSLVLGMIRWVGRQSDVI